MTVQSMNLLVPAVRKSQRSTFEGDAQTNINNSNDDATIVVKP